MTGGRERDPRTQGLASFMLDTCGSKPIKKAMEPIINAMRVVLYLDNSVVRKLQRYINELTEARETQRRNYKMLLDESRERVALVRCLDGEHVNPPDMQMLQDAMQPIIHLLNPVHEALPADPTAYQHP